MIPEREREALTEALRMADHKDEPTGYNLLPLETMSCAECIHKPIGAEICEEPCHYEPQTDCGDFADRLAYERGVKHAWEVAQKVFDSTVTFYEAKDVAKQIDKDINVRNNNSEKPNNCEPQTDCAWR